MCWIFGWAIHLNCLFFHLKRLAAVSNTILLTYYHRKFCSDLLKMYMKVDSVCTFLAYKCIACGKCKGNMAFCSAYLSPLYLEQNETWVCWWLCGAIWCSFLRPSEQFVSFMPMLTEVWKASQLSSTNFFFFKKKLILGPSN